MSVSLQQLRGMLFVYQTKTLLNKKSRPNRRSVEKRKSSAKCVDTGEKGQKEEEEKAVEPRKEERSLLCPPVLARSQCSFGEYEWGSVRPRKSRPRGRALGGCVIMINMK